MGTRIKTVLNIPEILFWLMGMMFLMPIIPRGVRPVIIALLIIGSITSAILEKEQFKWGYFILNSGLFIVYLVSLSYTNDFSYGIRKVSTASSLIIFPGVIACMSKPCLKYILNRRHTLMWLFITATLFLNLIAFLVFSLSYTFDEVLLHYVNIIRSDLWGLKIHPIYLSMHIGVSIIFSLFLINRGLSWKKLLLLIVINITLILFLILLIKKGPIIALIIVSGYLILMFKKKALQITYGIAVTAFVAIIIFVPKVNTRFSELLQIENAQDETTSSTNIRFSIYECATKVLPEAGIFGYGIGDGKNELMKCYKEKAAFLSLNAYNSHNQYLGIILKVGYLGLFFYLLFLIYHLVRAFYKGNYLFIALLLFYSIVMFSENILEREDGVLYFCLFINLFLMLDFKFDIKDVTDKPIDKIVTT